MGLDQDITADLQSDEPPRSPPVVVVQYRRGLWVSVAPALVVLILAGAILSHRMKMRDWRGLSEILDDRRSAEIARPERPIPLRRPQPPPLAPPPAAVVMEGSPLVPARLASRPHPPARRAVPMVPAPPLPRRSRPTEVAAADVWKDIRREAEHRKAETAVLAEVKEHQFIEDRQNAARRQILREDEQRRLAEEGREAFHARLLQLRKTLGDKAAPAIRDLCENHGVRLMTTVPRPRDDQGGLTSSGRRERVVGLRASGFSEAEILDDLHRLEERNKVARNGPRTLDDALLRATDQLLRIPVTAVARTSHSTAKSRAAR